MPTVQNLHFTAPTPHEELGGGPPGESFILALANELAGAGWATGGMDEPPGYGWSVVCRRDSSELKVILSQIEEGRWILQVRPDRIPGLIGKLFGGKPSATPGDVHLLAVAVHQALEKLGHLGSPRWRWDDFPEEGHSTAEPQIR